MLWTGNSYISSCLSHQYGLILLAFILNNLKNIQSTFDFSDVLLLKLSHPKTNVFLCTRNINFYLRFNLFFSCWRTRSHSVKTGKKTQFFFSILCAGWATVWVVLFLSHYLLRFKCFKDDYVIYCALLLACFSMIISWTGYGKQVLCIPPSVRKSYVCTTCQQSLAEISGVLWKGQEGSKLWHPPRKLRRCEKWGPHSMIFEAVLSAVIPVGPSEPAQQTHWLCTAHKLMICSPPCTWTL